MSVQRTRTTQLRAQLTTPGSSEKYAVQFQLTTHVRSILNWIIATHCSTHTGRQGRGKT